MYIYTDVGLHVIPNKESCSKTSHRNLLSCSVIHSEHLNALILMPWSTHLNHFMCVIHFVYCALYVGDVQNL